MEAAPPPPSPFFCLLVGAWVWVPKLETLPPRGGEWRVLHMVAVSRKRVLQCDHWRRIGTRVKVRTKTTVRKGRRVYDLEYK